MTNKRLVYFVIVVVAEVGHVEVAKDLPYEKLFLNIVPHLSFLVPDYFMYDSAHKMIFLKVF